MWTHRTKLLTYVLVYIYIRHFFLGVDYATMPTHLYHVCTYAECYNATYIQICGLSAVGGGEAHSNP